MARMPPALRDALDAAWAALAARPTHVLHVTDRLPIYAALNADGAEIAHRARTWLAIHAARHVLHQATRAVPAEVQLPTRDIEVATQLVEGALGPEASEVRAQLEAEAPDFILSWPTDVAFNITRVVAAFYAARRALLEAVQHDQGVEHLAEYRRRGPDGNWIFAKDWSDAELMFTGASDPAAPASVAASWDERRGGCAATDLLRFWEDWLIFGVPGAWDAAHRPAGIESNQSAPAQHRLRFFFEWGATSCLWGADPSTMEAFGTLVDPERLPLAPMTVAQIGRMCTWYQDALHWDNPPDPSPWRQEECDRFNREAAILLDAIRRELGEGFTVIDVQGEQREDPRLDEYLRDPKAYYHKRGIND